VINMQLHALLRIQRMWRQFCARIPASAARLSLATDGCADLELVSAVRDLRAAEPALGNKALAHRLKLLHPGSAFGCKEVRAALHQLEADEQRTTADATASAQSTLEVNPTLHDDRLLRLEGMPTLQISQKTLQSDATLQEVKQSGGVLSGLGTAAPRLSSEGIDPRLSLEGIDPRLSLEGMDDPKAHQEQLVGNAATRAMRGLRLRMPPSVT
jgi:hypothetical protein